MVFKAVDYFLFLKKGYSFWKHLVPFLVAALLLLLLSVPKDNLLLQLAGSLQSSLRKPDFILVPAVLLTIVATIVYFLVMYADVRRAYLWPKGDVRRTAITGALYMTLCTLLAIGVLRSAPPPQTMTSLAVVWTSFIIAVFSLTGIGWTRPGSWVENIGLEPLDYTEGRTSARDMTQALTRVRDAEYGEERHVREFLRAAKGLRENVEKNLDLEPSWAKQDLEKIKAQLDTLIQVTETIFPTDGKTDVSDFAAACKCQKEGQYQDFVMAIRGLSTYWNKWKCRSQ
jgi:hypothetical protein